MVCPFHRHAGTVGRDVIGISTGLKRILCLFIRIVRRVERELKYTMRKTAFWMCSFGIIDRHKIFAKRVERHVRDVPLRVFLNRSLAQIDQEIEADVKLKHIIVSEGSLAMQHTFLILNEHRSGMFDPKTGHYRWSEDFITGYRYPNCFYQDVRKSKTFKGTDIKIPWETSRMQCLFALALSYRATRDETYAKRITEIVRDFCVCCPYDTGVNWNNTMEVSIRISNILLACELIQDASCFDATFRRFLAVTVYEHMLHIRRNLESPSSGNNHLLADLLGLAATCSAVPYLPKAKRYAAYGERMLHREIMRQILPDGGDFEGSVSYQRLVGEILSFAVIAQEKIGFVLTEAENERLAKMGKYTASLRMGNGLVPQFGDNDSGRVFQLSPENTRDHDSFVNLVSSVTKNTLLYPDRKDGFFIFFREDISIHTDFYGQPLVQMFPDTKLLRVKKDGVFFAFSSIAPERKGHSHNDVLSFVLSRDREEFITDPGSGEYLGNREIAFANRSVHAHSSVSIDGEEQRMPTEDCHPFIWNTTVHSTLQQEGFGGDDIRITGTCSYRNSSGGEVRQERNIVVLPSVIVIQDRLWGMKHKCSMVLPVFPGTSITKVDDGVILSGQKHRLKVSGTYQFSVVSSLFAEQYKKLVPNHSVLCSSNANENELRLEWLN